MSTKTYSKEYALEQLVNYYNKYGQVPTKKIINESITPKYDVYYDYFGSLSNALYEAGLINKSLTKEEKIEISINELIKLASQLNRCPTVSEYESIKHDGLARRNLENYLKLKYNDICRKYIPQYTLNQNMDITKEQIFSDIKAIIDQYGVMGYQEMKNKGLTYSYQIFENKCGMSFNQIIESLGYIPTGSTTFVKSKEQLLSEFYDLFITLNRIPYVRDFIEVNGISNHSTYIKHFGSIPNVCKLLNIDFNKYYKSTSSGKTCIDKNGATCRSYIECIISNCFIDNDFYFVREPKYSELIKEDTRKFDWKVLINQQWYYIEFAGMYYSFPQGKIVEDYKKRTDKKIEDLKSHGQFDKCLFIFPKDIKNRTLQEIFEPFFNIKLKDIDYKYKVKIREYYNLTDNQLLDIIMKYSNNSSILPSTSIISRKESGVYKEILNRYNSYQKFADHFKLNTTPNNKRKVD